MPPRSYRAHRQALEEQQRAATVFMSEKGKVRARCCTNSPTSQDCESMGPFIVALQTLLLLKESRENVRYVQTWVFREVCCVLLSHLFCPESTPWMFDASEGISKEKVNGETICLPNISIAARKGSPITSFYLGYPQLF